MRKGWTEQEIQQRRCYTAAVLLAVCWQPLCWKTLISPRDGTLTLSHYTPVTISSPKPISSHLHIPCPSVSLLLLPQTWASAQLQRCDSSQPRWRVSLQVCRWWVQGYLSRLWLCSVPLAESLVPGHAAGCTGTLSSPPGPLHCLVFNSTSHCSSGTQPWVAV